MTMEAATHFIHEVERPAVVQSETLRNSKAADAHRRREIEQLISEANKTLAVAGSKVTFSIEGRSRKIVITVRDKETGAVLRQIPSAEVQKVSAEISELLGVLIDKLF